MLLPLVFFALIRSTAAQSSDKLPVFDSKPWFSWLGPLSPRSMPLPEVPSPLRDPHRVWTIERALARALQANPDVQVALATVQRHDGARLQAAAAMLPRLGVSASADERDKGLIDRSAEELARAGNPLTPLTPISSSSWDIRFELRQTLFDGLGSWHQVRRLALLEKKASVDARELYLRVASQIRQAYDSVLARQQVVASREEAVRDLTRLASVAKRRLAAGRISEFESLRAESALRAAEADLAQAASDLARAEEAFCRMLYIEKPSEGLRLTGTIAPLDYHTSFDEALRRARAERLDLRSAELQLEAARMGQRAVTGGLLPRIEGFVNYGYRTSYYDYDRRLEGWSFGVLGRWDVFDGGQTAGAMRAQRAERRIAEIRLAETQKVIGSQIRELYSALQQHRTVMAAHASARDLGLRSVREARRLYEAGGASLEEVLSAEVAYRQATIGWLSAVLTLNITVYQLDYATANAAFLDAVAENVQ